MNFNELNNQIAAARTEKRGSIKYDANNCLPISLDRCQIKIDSITLGYKYEKALNGENRKTENLDVNENGEVKTNLTLRFEFPSQGDYGLAKYSLGYQPEDTVRKLLSLYQQGSQVQIPGGLFLDATHTERYGSASPDRLVLRGGVPELYRPQTTKA